MGGSLRRLVLSTIFPRLNFEPRKGNSYLPPRQRPKLGVGWGGPHPSSSNRKDPAPEQLHKRHFDERNSFPQEEPSFLASFSLALFTEEVKEFAFQRKCSFLLQPAFFFFFTPLSGLIFLETKQ
uniref:Uncharacterized protein n=1 Tax=Micrurus corallinus TaxID=54390 RepID=A0A2D4FY15_MICCO